MNKLRIIVLTLLSLFAIPIITIANDKHNQQEGNREIHLSKDLKQAVSEEMIAIQDGMKNLVPAIASGNWDAIAEIADNIKKSYIMKQKLTQNQLKELRQSLPPGFKQLDYRFHETAGRLSHAAKEQDGELVNFYFYKLNESCVNCHSIYARKMFPKFITHKKVHTHH